MAMRRVARSGLSWAEPAAGRAACRRSAPPTASTSRSLSHAVSLEAHGHAQPQHAHAQGWEQLSNASQSLFSASPQQAGENGQAASAASASRSGELLPAVRALVDEVKRPRPDANRCWTLFHAIDSDGLAASIPLVSLHGLLAAIYSPAPRNLTIEKATALGRDYATKVDLIRLRIQQSGGTVSLGHWKALFEQYRAYRYGPGAMRAWSEMVAAGDAPSPLKCKLVFETLAAWVELHGRDAGRAVERAAAAPLAQHAVQMLVNDIGLERTAHIDRSAEPLLELVAKSGDFALLIQAVKALYGFDVRLPGALVDAKASQRAQFHTLGERELYWILVGLGQANELSTMVAVFETFDAPDRASSPRLAVGGDDVAPFFSSTFSQMSLSAAEADAQPAPPTTREDQAHLIGTRAIQAMVQTAARLDQPALVRHYFDLLFCRWEAGVNELLASWEQATGLTLSELAAQTPPAPWIGSPFANSLTSVKHRHLARAPSPPEQPYRLPVSLVMLAGQYAYSNYQAATSKWNRIRTKRIIQLLEEQASRLERILEKLEPTEAASPDTASGQSQPIASTSAAPKVTLARVLREFRKVTADLAFLRETLSLVKHNNRIVHTADARHLQQYELSLLRRQAAHIARASSRRSGGGAFSASKEERTRLERLQAKRSRKVDIWTARLAKYRIDKMIKVEGRGAGDRRFDAELQKLVDLREKLVPGHARPTQTPVEHDSAVPLAALP
ncbi:hypothetical protein JCM8202v2_003257 [Rhodotorula sphaerocarpa]